MSELKELIADASDMTPQQRVARIYENPDVPLHQRQQVAGAVGDHRWSFALGTQMNQQKQKIAEEEKRELAENPARGIDPAIWAMSDQAKVAERKAQQEGEEEESEPAATSEEEESSNFDPEDPWGTGNDPHKGTGYATAAEQAERAEQKVREIRANARPSSSTRGQLHPDDQREVDQAIHENISAKLKMMDAISRE